MTLSEDTVDARRPDQRYASIRDLWNGSNAWYNAALANLFLHAGEGCISMYRIGSARPWTMARASRSGTPAAADSQWEYERHKDLRARSDFDQPQSFRTRVSYETPSFASARRWVRALAGGWNISTIGLLKSGTPFAVYSGSDAPGYGNADGTPWDRPMLVNLAVLGRTNWQPGHVQATAAGLRFRVHHAGNDRRKPGPQRVSKGRHTQCQRLRVAAVSGLEGEAANHSGRVH